MEGIDTPGREVESNLSERAQRVLKLSLQLCEIQSVSAIRAEDGRLAEIKAAMNVARTFAEDNGLRLIEMQADAQHPYPYLIITFQENDPEKDDFKVDLALVGHLDVVPVQNSAQFEPKVDGNLLVGRGTADMKTVVASHLVWMAEQQVKNGSKPKVAVLISACEEVGSVDGFNTKDARLWIEQKSKSPVDLAVVGERTGEMKNLNEAGNGLPPPICDSNRGWIWERGEVPGGMSPSEAFALFTELIGTGHRTVTRINREFGEDNPESPSAWRTSFTNAFLRVGADREIREGHWVLVQKGGVAGHAASMTPDQVNVVVPFGEVVNEARERFGAEHVSLGGVQIGEDLRFNTVSGGGNLSLKIDGVEEEIRAWFDDVSRLHAGLSSEIASRNRIEHNGPSFFGLDIRDLPEHGGEISTLRGMFRGYVERAGGRFETFCDGEGWTCPKDNAVYQALVSSWEAVHRRAHVPTGKIHGNDGRFWDGNAVIFGQAGYGPHGSQEAHDITSIEAFLAVLDHVAGKLAA